MGSTTPPDSSKELEHSETPVNDPTKSEELERLLKIKDQEIRSLRFQLEKYKLALSQSQVEQHQQRVLPADSRPTTGDNNESLLGFPQTADASLSACPTTETILSEVVGSRKVAPTAAAAAASHDEISDASLVEASLSKESPSHSSSRMLARQSTASACSATSGFGGKVVFKTGTDGEEDDDDNDDRGEEHDGKVHDKDGAFKLKQEVRDANASQSEGVPMGVDDLYSVIQDVGEIDLTSELKRERKRRRRVRAISLNSDIKSIDKGLCDEEDDDDDEEDRENNADRDGGNDADADDDDDDDEVEDIISEGLLTSLTDAAISNLSQLAALQERCESQDSSQQQPSRYPEQQQPLAHSEIRSAAIEPQVPSAAPFASHISATTPLASIVSSSSSSSTCLGSLGRRSQRSDVSSARELDTGYNPFSASNIASQAALAISAAAAAAAAASVHQEPNSSSPQSINLAHPPSSSLSPPSSATTNLHADLSSGQSLASAVAAAAVAAANDQVQQAHHHHSHHAHNTTHQLHSTPQSRLISSALSSPEFYHNLQQQHQRSQQAALPHQMSPISALHSYSPTTPSPSSLLAQSRRPGSNASSSFMSPICSPNYLRRQFMPDRLQPMMSPSPSSLTTGSSSAASTSLAHILQQHQQHHQQQRSASAMAGPITSTSTTPLSGTGSSVMSPLMNSKNSSQARLNNMQIRHKFGYLGSGRGQFNSPHGFCLGLNQEIVVADTNNHRICIFDKSGSYITQFGSPGKEEGQLWNPRKVAILHRTVSGASGGGGGGGAISGSVGQHHHHHQRQVGQVAASTYSSHFTSTGGIQNTNAGTSGQLAASEPLYVVCDRGAERSRMQLFTKDGSFIKKIGIHYIDIVAGLAITQNGLIIVVDSVSPTVYIINAETGTLNGWFDCSGHMKEPSDIAVKSEIPGNEYFICDFKGHCVVVFNEQGEYLRKIGHDGLTSYPNGIDISDDGDILVGDSHGNRFHVVVFDRNGNFVSQFECPHVKVSRCCGLKITREGYIVTLAKNNHHVLVLDTIHI